MRTFNTFLYLVIAVCLASIAFLLVDMKKPYGGKVRPCLCTCPFVPVCPFVPENQPRRDQGQLETKIGNFVEHFAENFRLCWNSSCQFFSCYTYHLFIAWVWQESYEVLDCSRGDFQEKFSVYVEIFSKSVKIVSFCPWISIFCVFLCTLSLKRKWPVLSVLCPWVFIPRYRKTCLFVPQLKMRVRDVPSYRMYQRTKKPPFRVCWSEKISSMFQTI